MYFKEIDGAEITVYEAQENGYQVAYSNTSVLFPGDGVCIRTDDLLSNGLDKMSVRLGNGEVVTLDFDKGSKKKKPHYKARGTSDRFDLEGRHKKDRRKDVFHILGPVKKG